MILPYSIYIVLYSLEYVKYPKEQKEKEKKGSSRGIA